MNSEIRTFVIPDTNGEEEKERMAAFLRTVEVQRIDTAYAEGAWRVLILFLDLKHREETRQIETAIAEALNSWRDRAATAAGVSRDAVLADEVVQEIAHFAPTTVIELNAIAASKNTDLSLHAVDIVQVVRQTLDELID
ncbi:MAG TPA: HRDC domain-containing protein [Azospirillaceae bacterium]|nr:HRDC domain-containing protein [Azospirillaceae bacterium]